MSYKRDCEVWADKLNLTFRIKNHPKTKNWHMAWCVCIHSCTNIHVTLLQFTHAGVHKFLVNSLLAVNWIKGAVCQRYSFPFWCEILYSSMAGFLQNVRLHKGTALYYYLWGGTLSSASCALEWPSFNSRPYTLTVLSRSRLPTWHHYKSQTVAYGYNSSYVLSRDEHLT